MRSFIHIEIRNDAQRDYWIAIMLPIQYFTMLFLAILIDSNDCILMSQFRCLKNTYNLEFIAFLTLPWFQALDSCELGLLGFGCIRPNPAASHFGQAIPDCRSVPVWLFFLFRFLLFLIEPQRLIQNVQRGVHIPVMLPPAIFAHPFAFR